VAKDADKISFLDPDVQRCPFTAYEALFADNDVRREPATGFIDLMGYDHLRKAALDPKRFSSEHSLYGDKSHSPVAAEINRLYKEHGVENMPALINADAPLHRKHRSLVDQSFKAQRVQKIEEYIIELTDTLIDRFTENGEAEFISEFAMLLPLYVIADTIGISRERALDFKRWSDALIEVHEPGIPDDAAIALTHEVIEMHQFFAAEYEKARSNPGENILGDLAKSEVDDAPVTTQLAVNILQGILVAGNESTTSALGSNMRVLCVMPKYQQILRDDPAKIQLYVEEILRLYPPLPCQFRRNTEDMQLSGVDIAADTIINMRFGAGNRDERRFENADELNLDRPNMRQHLAFGAGAHICLGQALARAEMKIALERLLARLKNFRLAGEPEFTASYIAYGPTKLPIAFDRR
jgi:cytochrome P450